MHDPQDTISDPATAVDPASAMSSRTTGELLLDLLDITDELPATIPQAKQLQDLLGQLRRAAKAERAAATKQIGELETERDSAVQQLAKANTERDGAIKRLADSNRQLEAAKDEKTRLRDEVKHFEESLRAKKKDGISSTAKAATAMAKDSKHWSTQHVPIIKLTW